jgi:23S rRNA pseudouridine2605 synthase
LLSRKQLEGLRQGVYLAEGFARAVSARVVRAYKHSTLLEIVLAEGRNREIRRILARAGHKVERLRRVAIGPLRLAGLPPGEARPLTRDEVRHLKRFARDTKKPARPPGRPSPAAGKAHPTRATSGGGKSPRGSSSKAPVPSRPGAVGERRRKPSGRPGRQARASKS